MHFPEAKQQQLQAVHAPYSETEQNLSNISSASSLLPSHWPCICPGASSNRLVSWKKGACKTAIPLVCALIWDGGQGSRCELFICKVDQFSCLTPEQCVCTQVLITTHYFLLSSMANSSLNNQSSYWQFPWVFPPQYCSVYASIISTSITSLLYNIDILKIEIYCIRDVFLLACIGNVSGSFSSLNICVIFYNRIQ